MNRLDANPERVIPFRAALAQRGLPQPGQVTIGLFTPTSTGRHELEARIAAQFKRKYDARIGSFLPYLVSLCISGRHGAVTGLRPAREAPLFLEQYFDGPIEQAISRTFHTPVSRDQVVEVGNLAATLPGAAPLLFGVLAAVLHQAGMRWVVCTATPRVRRLLDGLSLPSRMLRAADPAALGESLSDWGSYYENRPRVIAGDAAIAAEKAAANPLLAMLTAQLADSIEPFAATLRTAW